jgi:hypothetical protein
METLGFNEAMEITQINKIQNSFTDPTVLDIARRLCSKICFTDFNS